MPSKLPDGNELERMGKRRFMENLGAIGLSTTALKYITPEKMRAVTEDPTEGIHRRDRNC